MSTDNDMSMWEMSKKLNLSQIPDFVKGKFMLVRLAPPRGKTVRDGIVSSVAMLSYEGENGEVDLVEVNKTPGGYQVSFPKGKRGILATKFRGPKSFYRFFNNVEQKWYEWGENDRKTGVNSNFTLQYAKEYLAGNDKNGNPRVPDWENLSDEEKDIHIDKYYQDKYMEGLAKDFNLDIEVDKSKLPQVGMVTNFYRRSTPPKEGERFSNIIVTKFAPREGKETLSGENKLVDAEIATSIYDALTRREDTSFKPEDFIKDSEDSQDDDFDMAA